MASGGGEPEEGKEWLGMVVNNIGTIGGKLRVLGMLFKEVVYAVLLSGLDTWVMTPAWSGTWSGFITGLPDRL